MSREELDNAFDREPEKELEAVRDRLASFHPPPLELDRDRVMFLAGQASVAGQASPSGRLRTGWVWPGAFAGMTAAAAGLLVIVLLQSGREIARQPGATEEGIDTVWRGRRSPPRGAEPRSVDMEDDRRSVPKPLPAVERAPAIAGLPSWLETRLSGKARHDQLVRQIAEHGFDDWESPVAMSTQDEGQDAVRIPYGEWLELLRAEREFGRPVTEWKALARETGANS
jgi:hypothetical protein